MLSELEKDGLSDVVSWQPHGRCFHVHKQKRFVKEVLPLWFRQSRYQSFQRQLNIYGFKRLTTGRDKGSYYHELFLRGKRFLCQRIQRVKVKGTKTRQASSPETEPNFYLQPFLPLDNETQHAETSSTSSLTHTSSQPQTQSSQTKQVISLPSTTDPLPFLAMAHAMAQQRDVAELRSLFASSIPAGQVLGGPVHLLGIDPLPAAVLLGDQRAQITSETLMREIYQQRLRDLLLLRSTTASPIATAVSAVSSCCTAPTTTLTSSSSTSDNAVVLEALLRGDSNVFRFN